MFSVSCFLSVTVSSYNCIYLLWEMFYFRKIYCFTLRVCYSDSDSSSWIMEVQVIIFQVMWTLSSSFSFHWKIWKMLFTELPGFLTLIEIVYIKFLAHKISLQMWVLAFTEVVFILINVYTHFLSTNERKFQDKMKQFLATFVMRSQLTGLLWLTLYTLQFLRNSSVLTS